MNYSFERLEELLITMFFLSSSFENQICYSGEQCPEWQVFLLERRDSLVKLRHVVKSILFAN